MSDLRRLEGHRFVGVRDTMRVYDTDDPDEAAMLAERLADDRLIDERLVQTFGPDTLAEARNRGFRPRPLEDG